MSQKDMLGCPKALLHERLEVIVCLDYQRLRLCSRGLAVAVDYFLAELIVKVMGELKLCDGAAAVRPLASSSRW